MKNLTTKAIRATIFLGGIELDVFQLPDQSYQISQSHTTKAVNKPPKRMVQLANSEKGQILIQSGFEKGLKVSVEGSKPVNLVPLVVAFQFWVLELAIGNQDALALVLACGVEALERRADAAFNVIRTEEERNDRFAARLSTKTNFKPLTDELQAKGFSENWQFGKFVSEFQKTVGFQNGDRDKLDLQTLLKLNNAQAELRILMRSGVDPWMALEMWQENR